MPAQPSSSPHECLLLEKKRGFPRFAEIYRWLRLGFFTVTLFLGAPCPHRPLQSISKCHHVVTVNSKPARKGAHCWDLLEVNLP